MDLTAKQDFEKNHNFNFETIDQDFEYLNYHFKSTENNLVIRQSYFDILSCGVREALHCGYDKLIAIEFGVAGGGGLIELCHFVDVFRIIFNLDIQVYGFDNVNGLPPPVDYKDHPEIWHENQFPMDKDLKNELPDYCHLIFGDVKQTVPKFIKDNKDYKICFVSLDLDYYSSTVDALKLFDADSEKFLPAVPLYVDDVYGIITYNPWCGAEGAINNFNSSHELRKIHANNHCDIEKLFICQVFDHPIRSGMEKPLEQFSYILPRKQNSDPNKSLTINAILRMRSGCMQ